MPWRPQWPSGSQTLACVCLGPPCWRPPGFLGPELGTRQGSRMPAGAAQNLLEGERSGGVRWAGPWGAEVSAEQSRKPRVWEVGLGPGLGVKRGQRKLRSRFPESGVRGGVGVRRRKRPSSKRNCGASEPHPLLQGPRADQVRAPQEGGSPGTLNRRPGGCRTGRCCSPLATTGWLPGKKEARPENGWQPGPQPESQVSSFCPRFPGNEGGPQHST